MGLAKPIICSDIPENVFVVESTALTFSKSNVASLKEKLCFSLEHEADMRTLGEAARARALKEFSWKRVTQQHEVLFEHTDHKQE
jgi:glycosyltransferase involved in cell wall biosynthesis